MGITITAGPEILVLSVGKLNCLESSFWKAESASDKISSDRIDNVVFLSKSIFSESSLQIAMTFPRTLNRPPNISEILSFEDRKSVV